MKSPEVGDFNKKPEVPQNTVLATRELDPSDDVTAKYVINDNPDIILGEQ